MATLPGDDERTDDSDATDGSTRCVSFDPGTDSVVETIATAVADLEDASPTEIEPLYRVVDTDALEAIVESVATRPVPADAGVTVRYHGYTVSVHSYGVVEIAA